MIPVPVTDFRVLDGHFPADVLEYFVRNSSFMERERCVRVLQEVMRKKEKMKIWSGQENIVFDFFEAIISQLMIPHGNFPVQGWEAEKARILMDIYFYSALQYDGDQDNDGIVMACPRAIFFIMSNQSGKYPLYESGAALQKILEYSLLTDCTKIERFEKLITQFLGEVSFCCMKNMQQDIIFSEETCRNICSVLSFLVNAKYFPKKVKTALTVLKRTVLVNESRLTKTPSGEDLWRRIMSQLAETESVSNEFC